MKSIVIRSWLVLFVAVFTNKFVAVNSNSFVGKVLTTLHKTLDKFKKHAESKIDSSPESYTGQSSVDYDRSPTESEYRVIHPFIIKTSSTSKTEILIDMILRLSTTCTWLYICHKLMMSMSKSVGNYLTTLTGDQTSISTNITSLLPQNCTLNSYEIEIAGSLIYPSNIDMDMKKTWWFEICQKNVMGLCR